MLSFTENKDEIIKYWNEKIPNKFIKPGTDSEVSSLKDKTNAYAKGVPTGICGGGP